jgi:hypothetical protein
MPKVSVYLPDELYREARMRQLPLSSLVREAVERALRNSDRQEWVARVRSRPRRHDGAIDTALLPVLRARGVRRVIVLDASALVDAVLDSLLRGGFSSRSPARTSAPLRTSRRRCSPHCPGSSARARSSPASARDALDEATALPQRLVLPDRCSPAARLRPSRAYPRAGRLVRRARR